MIGEFFRGSSYFMRGMSLIMRRGIRVWALIPVLLSLFVWCGLIWVGASFFDDGLRGLLDLLPGWLASAIEWVEGWMPDWLERVLIWLPFVVLSFFLFTFTFVALSAIIASPFNGMLAEAVECKLGGEVPQLSWGELAKRTPHILVQESKKILYYVFWAIPFGVASLVLFFTPLSPLSAVPWFAFSAWMMSLEFSDFSMDNNGLHFHEMRQRLRTRKWLYLGFGAAALLASSVPFVAIVVVPSGVAGATAIWHDIIKPEQAKAA